MIRLILTVLFVVLFLIVSLPIQFVLFLFEKAGKPAVKDHVSLALVQWAFRVVLFLCGVKVTVIGEENVPKDRAVLYIGNHNSFFDTVITYARVPRLTGYISKDSMNKIPGLRIWMRYLHCLFLDRTDIRKGMQMMLDAVAQIKSGISMTIFPEGTRNKSGDELALLPFKGGSFKIAEKAGCPIVPMAMTGTADILENHFPRIKSTKVTLQYGTPIETASMDRAEMKQLPDMTKEVILTMLKEQKGLST